jgi:C4-dicarboxylate-specific signal transduction histidine kinase
LEKNLQQEMQLYEQSKMVSMGEMIGNIAHQWRQPLSAITASNSALQVNRLAGIDDDESFNSLTSHIKKNAEYLSETIDIFRDFIKENKELKEQVVQERIQKALDIVKATFNDYHIELIKSIINTPIVIAMPSGELDQVLINIFNNAKDVIKEKSIKNPWVKLDVYRENENLIISIEDNAGGIPEKVMGKIFEPYFTTKHKSQGTGLGLHMSYKIITETFGGKLYAKNTKHGAKFFIEIPLNCGINI